MENRNYISRLEKFNETEKYIAELSILEKKLDLKNNEVVLDYGCGIGTAIDFLKKRHRAYFYGYDIEPLFLSESPKWFIQDIDFVETVNTIYFLHSIAHIPNINEVLNKLNNKLNSDGKIVVITPNKTFDDFHVFKFHKEGYKSDLTVVKHFTIETLVKVFVNNSFSVVDYGFFGKEVQGIKERIFLIAKKNK